MLIGTMLLVFSCVPAAGQTNVVSIDTAGMPAAVKAAIANKMKTDEITTKIETYGKWAGMGKEIGTAAREGLGAVKDVAIDLSNSNLGKTVMFLIIWKVAGVDMVRMIIGFLIMIVITIFVTKSYFRTMKTSRLTKKSGLFLWPTKEYEPFDSSSWYGSDANRSAAQFIHVIVWISSIGIAFAIGFA